MKTTAETMKTMELKSNKIDLKKELAELYSAKKDTVKFIEVPELQYLMCDGYGDPNNSQLFADAVEALFSLSYTIKFMFKKRTPSIDYAVMPLEGLWWSDDIANFSMDDRSAWRWTLMLLQPDFVSAADIATASDQLQKKKNPKMLSAIRFEKMIEGTCAQTMHLGPFNTEPETIKMLHNTIAANGYKLTGKHREIYLSDMRKTAPEKLKTILRQPVEK